LVVGERCNCAGGISTNSRKRNQVFKTIGKLSLQFFGHNLSRFVNISGSTVVTKSFPVTKDFGFFGLGQSDYCRKSGNKSFIIGNDSADGGLLQHDFADPDAIGIVCSPPRQVARILPIPANEFLAKWPIFSRIHCGFSSNWSRSKRACGAKEV